MTSRALVWFALLASVIAFAVMVHLSVLALLSPAVCNAEPRTFPGHPSDASGSSPFDLGHLVPRTVAPATTTPTVTIPWGGAR